MNAHTRKVEALQELKSGTATPSEIMDKYNVVLDTTNKIFEYKKNNLKSFAVNCWTKRTEIITEEF